MQSILIRQSKSAYVTKLDGQEVKLHTTEGVPQGDPLAPLTFVLAYEHIQRFLDSEKPPDHSFSYEISDWISQLVNIDKQSVHLHRHLYVDDCPDLDTIKHTKDIGQQIQKLIHLKKQWGIHDNAEKGQVLVNTPITKLNKFRQGRGAKIPVNDKHIQISESAKYLGTYIQQDALADKAVQYRLSLATTAFSKYRHIWRSSTMSIRHKISIYTIAIRSVLLYSLEAHCLTTSQARKLEVFQMRCLRNIAKTDSYISRYK